MVGVERKHTFFRRAHIAVFRRKLSFKKPRTELGSKLHGRMDVNVKHFKIAIEHDAPLSFG